MSGPPPLDTDDHTSPPRTPYALAPTTPTSLRHFHTTAVPLSALSQASPGPSPVRPPLSLQQPIYVLSPDGSQLFLVDPSKPPQNEEPPPYAPFLQVHPVHPSPLSQTNGDAQHRQRAATVTGATDSTYAASGSGTPARAMTPSRSRERPRYLSSRSNPSVRGARLEGFTAQNSDETTPLLARSSSTNSGEAHNGHVGDIVNDIGLAEDGRSSSGRGQRRGLRRSQSAEQYGSVVDIQGNPGYLSESAETATSGVLGLNVNPDSYSAPPTPYREILCGERVPGESRSAFVRYWQPVWRPEYWGAAVHLTLINFIFAVLVWPICLVGVLTGTVLLITLPLGAVVWWITVIIARLAAKFEISSQLFFHAPFPGSHAVPYRAIFYRRREETRLYDTPDAEAGERTVDNDVGEWDTRFLKCSWAMLCDHYSYTALTYFLLIKPLVVIPTALLTVVVVPVALGLIVPLPIALRLVRHLGRWQASTALENLR